MLENEERKFWWNVGSDSLVFWMHILFCHRGLATGIYTTNSPEACQYVAHDCEANVLVVENNKQLIKILQVVEQLHLVDDSS